MPKKEAKSFKKFAKKHLAQKIEHRRDTAKGRKEKKDRDEKKKKRDARAEAAEEAEHQADLAALKDLDPEFHSYLETEDPTLLQYGDVDDDALDAALAEGGSDEDTETDEDDEGKNQAEDPDAPSGRVNADEIAKTVSSKAVDPAIDLMLSAARELGVKLKGQPRMTTTRKFETPDLVKLCVIKVAKHIAANVSSAVITRDKRLDFKNRAARDSMKRFMGAVISMLAECAGDVRFIHELAESTSQMVRAGVVNLIKGCTKTVLKACLALASDQDMTNRASGGSVLLAVARRSAGTRSLYQSACFKGVFLSVVRAAKPFTIHTMPTLSTLMNIVCAVYNTDVEAAYQHAYVFIRQLAIYLRAALQQQSQHNIQTIFNWQYVVSLRTWGMVIAENPGPKALGPLIHPLVQVGLGMMDLFNSPRMFPMHLHVCEVLNRVATKAGVYIPISPYLLRIMTSPSLELDAAAVRQANRDQQGGGQTDLQFTLRVKKAEARTKSYKENVICEALYLLVEHLAAHAHSIGFPEAFWSVSATLNKLKRDVKVPKVHSQIANVVQKMNDTVKFITVKRDQVNFGPSDIQQVKMFEDNLQSSSTKIPILALFEQLQKQRMEAFKAKVAKVAENNLEKKGSTGRKTIESYTEGGSRQRRAGIKRPRGEDDE